MCYHAVEQRTALYKEEKLGQGRDKSKEYLAENPAILNEIETLVREKGQNYCNVCTRGK